MAERRPRPTTAQRNAQTAPPRQFVTVQDAAQALAVTNDVIYQAIHEGELPAVRKGTRWVIPIEAFTTLVGQWKAEAEAEAARRRQILEPSRWLANRRRQQRLQKASGGLRTDGRGDVR